MTVSSLHSNPALSFGNHNTVQSPREPLAENKKNLEEDSSSKNSTTSKAQDAENALAQQRQLQQLKNRDREVRAHELAHVSVGSRYVTSGAQLTYEKGPDGRLYAVGGEVSIDTAAIPGDPQATLRKSQIVARAALAPANPSAQDRQVAAQATALAQQARVEIALLAEQIESNQKGSNIDEFA